MKILYYSPHPQLSMNAPTGYGTHMREMIAAWRKMGIEVHTCIAGDVAGEPYRGTEKRETGRFKNFKKFTPKIIWETTRDAALIRFDKKQAKVLESHILKFRPDVIYERIAYLQNSGIKMAKKYGIKHVSEINAPYPHERVSFSGKSLLLSKARKRELEILQMSDGISVVSSALKNHLVKIYPPAAAKIKVVPNAVNPSKATFPEGKPEELKAGYKIDDELVIGFVGSMFPYHGVDILIKAFAKFPKDFKARLLIVGDGSILHELKALARSLEIFHKIIFTGSLPHREVYGHIKIMDICCMPKSNWYGSPVKIFEYGILQKPVIAPAEVPMYDVMGPDDAELVKPNVDDFFGALKKLIDDKNRRKTIAANWHKKVMSEYTWEAAAKKTLALCT